MKGLSNHSYGFSSGHICMWVLDHKESWVPKNWWCFWDVGLEKTLQRPLDWDSLGSTDNRTFIVKLTRRLEKNGGVPRKWNSSKLLVPIQNLTALLSSVSLCFSGEEVEKIKTKDKLEINLPDIVLFRKSDLPHASWKSVSGFLSQSQGMKGNTQLPHHPLDH